MGFNCLKARDTLRGGSLLFTTKFPEIPVTHSIRGIWPQQPYCCPASSNTPNIKQGNILSISDKIGKNCPPQVRKRCGNPLGSAWRRQMNTISKNIINSSNDLKTQTSKRHTFSVLLFYQLSLYIYFSREFFHWSYKLRNNFQKPRRSSIRGNTRHQISEKYASENLF